MNRDLLNALEEIQTPITGSAIEEFLPVSGGCIHEAWKIKLSNGKELFAKTGTKQSWGMFLAETEGLRELKRWANPALLVIPEPIALEKIGNQAILILPWLKLQAGNQTSLGKGLAQLHKASANKNPGKFGWESHGFIGAGPQPGGWETTWGECFIRLRLYPQLELATQWGLDANCSKSSLLPLIPYLNSHNPSPSIVHGDLWSGNAFTHSDGRGVLIDPATWWADREVDIAMTKMFGGFSNEFYKGYESEWPLPDHASKRIDLYNFYHLLNHANLFGGSYKNQCFKFLNTLKSKLS